MGQVKFMRPESIGRGRYVAPTPSASYSTNFPLNETPISEGGRWLTGARDGIDWSNINTNGGLAYGTQANGAAAPPYNDSVACLSGFAANHRSQAVCHVELGNIGSGFHELAVWSRASISANVIRGYEFGHAFDGAYCGFTRFNGAINDFTSAAVQGTTGGALTTGCILMCTAVGTILSGYCDYGSGFVLLSQIDAATDTALVADRNLVWATGNPGFSHWNHGTTSTVTALAYSSYSAVSL